MNNEFKIFVFRAINEPLLCQDYLKGHAKVLKDFNIENVTSVKAEWVTNPNMYCLMLKSKSTGKLYGGIRIQIADGVHKLPVEDAVEYMEPRINDVVNFYLSNGGVGELCGLWVNNELRGIGMGTYLVRAAIASSDQLCFRTMIGICAKYSLQMFQNVGFTIDSTLGDHGNFSYPNEKYVAHVVGILDATTLNTADPYDKEIMNSLRSYPQQTRVEKEGSEKVKIDYDLIYSEVEKIDFCEKGTYQNPKSD